jgi:hypothetical protein
VTGATGATGVVNVTSCYRKSVDTGNNKSTPKPQSLSCNVNTEFMMTYGFSTNDLDSTVLSYATVITNSTIPVGVSLEVRNTQPNDNWTLSVEVICCPR